MHETVKLTIGGRECEVDVGMVPVVNWLNSIDGVQTEYCCQGNDAKQNPPYVSFTYENVYDIIPVLEGLRDLNFGCQKVQWVGGRGIALYWNDEGP